MSEEKKVNPVYGTGEKGKPEYQKPELNTISTHREIYGYAGNCSMGQATSPRQSTQDK